MFTVGGTIVGLWLAREHWWISVLIVVAVALALGFFSFGAAGALARRRGVGTASAPSSAGVPYGAAGFAPDSGSGR